MPAATPLVDLGVIAPINRPGQLDRRVFYQRQWWFDRAGRAHQLEEMPPAYRTNLYRFLFCQRRRLHAWDALATVTAEDPRELGRVLRAGTTGLLPHQLDVDAWFVSRPLVARIGQLVGRLPDTFVDGNPGHEITPAEATVENLGRAALLAGSWPVLRDHLATQGAGDGQLTALHDHLQAACRTVLGAD